LLHYVQNWTTRSSMHEKTQHPALIKEIWLHVKQMLLLNDLLRRLENCAKSTDNFQKHMKFYYCWYWCRFGEMRRLPNAVTKNDWSWASEAIQIEIKFVMLEAMWDIKMERLLYLMKDFIDKFKCY
jgi:hypothetical protein